MKAAFGLVGLLVTIGVIIWIMSAFYLPYTKTALQIQKQQTPRIQQFGGRDTNTGAAINTTYKVEPQSSNGKLQSLLVTSIDPTSSMVSVYGLQRDDSIVAISSHGDMEKVSDINDAEMAEDRLMDAYSGSWPIEVVRDGQEITLNAKSQPGATPMAAGGNKPAKSRDELQQQLDAIQQIPGQ